MKRIKLTKGKFALVDDEDFEHLNQLKWCVLISGNNVYARRHHKTGNKRITILMHREVLATPKGFYTDHINGNGLDNRKSNLRVCTQQDNMRNLRAQTGGTSKYKGVYWSKRSNKWHAQIKVSVDGTRKSLGFYSLEEDAYKAYCEAAKKYHGEFARFE